MWILLIVLIATAVVQLFHYLIIGTTILRYNSKRKQRKTPVSDAKPPVSVIICAKNEEENLRNFLPLVLEQDYPDYEVIIVNDGSQDDTIALINNFQQKYSNLYITSLSTETRIISHKKLAITVGAKAAKHEILLFTDADCRPWTKYWIETMVRNFTPDTEFVIGYGGYYRTNGFTGKITAYDTLTIAMQYMGFASIFKPYMGVGRNIAYRKSTFFKQKGFAGFLHMASGDDDLLVNAFGTKANTRIETTLPGKTMSLPKNNMVDWYYQKSRQLTTVDVYSSNSKMLLSIEPLTRGLFYATVIATAILYYNNAMVMHIMAGCFFLKMLTQTIIINVTAKKYKEKAFCILDILLFDILLPLITLYALTIGRIVGKKNRYVWK